MAAVTDVFDVNVGARGDFGIKLRITLLELRQQRLQAQQQLPSSFQQIANICSTCQ
jgi:hypothetical protein